MNNKMKLFLLSVGLLAASTTCFAYGNLALDMDFYIERTTQDIENIKDTDHQLASPQSESARDSFKVVLENQLDVLQRDKTSLSTWLYYNQEELNNNQVEQADAAIEAADKTLEQHGA